MSIQQMQDRIVAFQDKTHGRGASAEEIELAENALRIQFPKSFRRYLELLGWARFSHEELYGLGHDVPSHLDIMTNTLVERSDMRPALPFALIPVMNDGAGNHFCLNTDKMNDEECPIVFWDHEKSTSQNPLQVEPSFDAWLVRVLYELEE